MSETDGFKYQFAQLSFSFRFKGNLAVYIHVYSIIMAKPENCNYSSSGSYCNCSPYCHITLNNTHTRAQLLTALVSAFNICCGELFARNE